MKGRSLQLKYTCKAMVQLWAKYNLNPPATFCSKNLYAYLRADPSLPGPLSWALTAPCLSIAPLCWVLDCPLLCFPWHSPTHSLLVSLARKTRCDPHLIPLHSPPLLSLLYTAGSYKVIRLQIWANAQSESRVPTLDSEFGSREIAEGARANLACRRPRF